MGSVEEIIVTPLARIPVVGGDVLRAMKSDDIGYVNFGESYFSIVHPGAIKAWKRHLLMTLNLVVPNLRRARLHQSSYACSTSNALQHCQ